MRRTFLVAAIFTLALAQASAQSTQRQTECGTAIDSALNLSGFNDAARAMPEQVREQIDQQMRSNEGMPPETRKQLAGIAMRTFYAPGIVRSVKQNLMKDCDLGMLQSTIHELQSVTAQRIRQQEALSMTPDGQKGVNAFYADLEANPPAASRMALLERMDRSLAITDSTLDMILAISKGMVTGFGGKWGEPAEVEAMKLEYRRSIHNAMIANQLFTYRNISDEDLGRYVSIYETPAVHKFSDQLQQSMLQTMVERSEAMAREFHKYLGNNLPPGNSPAKEGAGIAAPKK